MKPASAVSTRNGRVAFVIGGSLFIASSIALVLETDVLTRGLGRSTYGPGQQEFSTALWAAAVIVFAWGVPGGGSVVARKPVGVVALSWFALAPPLLVAFLAYSNSNSGAGGDVMSVVYPLLLVFLYASPIAGFVGVAEIARVGAVPGGWRWVPAIVFLIGCIVFVAGAVQGFNLGQDEASKAADAVLLVLIPLVEFAAPLLLGLAAIGLAVAARSRPDVPREPATDPSAV